jgi:hypothetical protein
MNSSTNMVAGSPLKCNHALLALAQLATTNATICYYATAAEVAWRHKTSKLMFLEL